MPTGGGWATHVRALLVDPRTWVVFGPPPPPPPTALPMQMSTTVAPSKGLGFLVTQSVTVIMEDKVDLKGSSINKVLWPSHFQQFTSYITKMSYKDMDALLIADSKVVQAKIDSQTLEKALQAVAEEKVSFGQLGI